MRLAVGCNASLWRATSGPLAPVLGREGWGEGSFGERRNSNVRPLTPALSPEYRGEGARKSSGPGTADSSNCPSSRLQPR
jgi:hypothetical protein